MRITCAALFFAVLFSVFDVVNASSSLLGDDVDAHIIVCPPSAAYDVQQEIDILEDRRVVVRAIFDRHIKLTKKDWTPFEDLSPSYQDFRRVYWHRVDIFYQRFNSIIGYLQERFRLDPNREKRVLIGDGHPDYKSLNQFILDLNAGLTMIANGLLLPPFTGQETPSAMASRAAINALPFAERYAFVAEDSPLQKWCKFQKWHVAFNNCQWGPNSGENDLQWIVRIKQSLGGYPRPLPDMFNLYGLEGPRALWNLQQNRWYTQSELRQLHNFVRSRVKS